MPISDTPTPEGPRVSLNELWHVKHYYSLKDSGWIVGGEDRHRVAVLATDEQKGPAYAKGKALAERLQIGSKETADQQWQQLVREKQTAGDAAFDVGLYGTNTSIALTGLVAIGLIVGAAIHAHGGGAIPTWAILSGIGATLATGAVGLGITGAVAGGLMKKHDLKLRDLDALSRTGPQDIWPDQGSAQQNAQRQSAFEQQEYDDYMHYCYI